MKIFISWSGELSKEIGEALRTWLPAVLQTVKPYFTPDDIEKGARWNSEIAQELESSKLGIICVTRENLQSSWVMFEAGALSKKLDKSYVCPMLFGIENTDVKGPLVQFQSTQFSKTDTKKLIKTINELLGDLKLEGSVLDAVFEMWWPKLELQINEIMKKHEEKGEHSIRPDREILEEVLALSRMIARNNNVMRGTIHPKAVHDILQDFIDLHYKAANEFSHQDIMDVLKRMQKPIIHLYERIDRNDSEVNDLMSSISTLEFKVEPTPDIEPF